VTLLSRRRAAAAPARTTETGARLAEREQRLVWRLSGLLLDYPHPETLAMAERLAREAGALPAPAGPALVSFLAHLAAADPLSLAQDYVETFDLRRRHCLHLTYFAYGDTRKRGMALLRFKHAYKEAGVTLDERELPDHLPLLLEFAAIVDPDTGRRLLGEYQPVLELLRRALHEAGSPYAGLLDAIGSTLPELGPASLRRVAELAAQGPPEEEVGLEPYGIDPALDEARGERR
jgi:nitrate reductase delta subunit